jgi:hypothetical protein
MLPGFTPSSIPGPTFEKLLNPLAYFKLFFDDVSM